VVEFDFSPSGAGGTTAFALLVNTNVPTYTQLRKWLKSHVGMGTLTHVDPKSRHQMANVRGRPAKVLSQQWLIRLGIPRARVCSLAAVGGR